MSPSRGRAIRPPEITSHEADRIKGIHSGECLIVANGPSLTTKPLADVGPLTFPLTATAPELLTYPISTVPVPIITLNQAWKIVEPTYHHVCEQTHELWDREVYGRLGNEKKLIVAGQWWPEKSYPKGVRIKILGVRPGDPVWSDDMNKGVVLCFNVSGTVSYSAMQIAVWMGFTTLTFVGLDLYGPKFTGQKAGKLDKQILMFREAVPFLDERGIKVRVIGKDSRCDAFERIDWPY